ncbi:MAG: hypothetical protein IT244_12230, partial [Bacteroidia bacterium]|nr:hypothetical protein [Bacteroidia bacterium]
FNSPLNVQILSGEKLSLVSPSGTVTNFTGPAVVSVPANYQINTADSVRFLFSKSGRTDTIPAAFYQMRASYGDKPKIISRFKANYAGTKGIDYTVDFGKYRDMYYSKIPSAFDVKLIQRDMLHPMHCQSEAVKQVVMMNPKAGGTGAGLRIAGIPSFGGSQPNYGITFLLDGLKPGTTFSDVQINYDSSCGKNNFTPLNGLQIGGLPPGLPYPGYELYGNTPSTFSHQYVDNEICAKTGCPTIGIIVGNGVSKSGTKPLCADTQWYDNLVCFQKTNPDFKVNTQFGANNNNGYFKVCKYDSVRMAHPSSNRTYAGDVSEIVFNISTENAGPTYSLHSEKYIKEKYYYNSTLKDSGSTKYYNYIVVTRGGQDPVQIPGTNYWKNGNPKIYRKPDTIVTARILQLDTIVDFSNAWEPLKNELILKGFDPYAIDGKKLHKMIWNKKGTIGNPASGARGCIDVSSFEMLLRYYTQPASSAKIILHPRDTSLIPVDSIFRNGKWVHEYTFKPNHNGYYLLSRNMLSKNAACPVSSVYPCIVGFAHFVDYPDSIVTRNMGTSLSINIEPRYFHPDPINFGTWDHDNNSWRKPNNGIKIVPTKWDWSKADDDTSKPQTIFGGAPYGGSGLGSISSPWIQLGGGGPTALYYNQDTGVYTFRCILTDSAGCLDTFTGRVYITDLKAKFDAEIFTPSCNSIVDFKDKAELIIPHSNAKTESGNPLMLDFINYWSIQWGDGRVNTYSRNSPTDSGLPYRVFHKYNRNGWYQIVYQLKTWQGGLDTFKRWVKIPGARPAFEFATSSQKEITVNVNDEVEFINTSDSATAGADFTWFYGDGELDNLNSKSNVTHTYTVAGDYMVFLQQYDTFSVAPNVKKFCPAIYPDTPSQPAYIVHVLDVNSIKNLQGSVISFYPNPTEGMVSIRGTAAKSIQVYSISGVYCGNFELQHGKCNLNALAQGTYVLTGTEPSGETWKLKLVILRE